MLFVKQEFGKADRYVGLVRERYSFRIYYANMNRDYDQVSFFVGDVEMFIF